MKNLTCLVVLLLACGDDSGAVDASATTDAGDDAVAVADAGDDAAMDAPSGDAGASDAGDDAGAMDTWENFAADFMTRFCVECHQGGDGARADYRTITDVTRDMDGIRCGVTPVALADCSGFPPPNQFPIGDGPKPTDEERTRLVQWIEAGLP